MRQIITLPLFRRSLPRKRRSLPSRLMAIYDRYLQRQALAELDDDMLNDIGLTPDDVRRECATPFWR